MISIVIPTLNEEHYLPHLLSSLFACTKLAMEIVVVDGNSDDATQRVVKRFIKKAPSTITLRLLTTSVRNVAYQRNKGARASTHDILMFLDADTIIPTPRILYALIRAFKKKSLAVASCRFQPYEPDYMGKFFFNVLFVFHKVMEHITPYALGACIITKKEIFKKCKGFDVAIKINEDANFCLRASRYGRFVVLPYTLYTSTRRFKKYGYAKMGVAYVRIFLDRTIHGETYKKPVAYEFGKFK